MSIQLPKERSKRKRKVREALGGVERGRPVQGKCRAGGFVTLPFWSLKPVEADFSPNDNCCWSASPHRPSVQAWEVTLEARDATKGPLPSSPRSQCPGDDSVGPVPMLGLWKALESLLSPRPCHLAWTPAFPF